MKCKFCGNEFEPERITAMYCSDKCRVYSYRNKDSVTKDSVTDKDVTLTKKSETLDKELEKAREEAF